MYIYIFVIFESQAVSLDIKPKFVTFVESSDFRVINADIPSVCPVFYSLRCKPYKRLPL